MIGALYRYKNRISSGGGGGTGGLTPRGPITDIPSVCDKLETAGFGNDKMALLAAPISEVAAVTDKGLRIIPPELKVTGNA